MNFIKSTVLGGILFLVPLIVLVAVLGKAYEVMLRVAGPVLDMIPAVSVLGVALINIVTILLIILVCFVAGLVAKGRLFKGFVDRIDDKLTILLPGYAYLKSFTAAVDKDSKNPLQPVLVRQDDMSLFGFYVEPASTGHSVVYMPSAPDTTSGSVAIVEDSRITPLDANFIDTISSLRRFGLGSGKIPIRVD